MSKDLHAQHYLSTTPKTFHSVASKSFTLGLVFMLGACASPGEKPAETAIEEPMQSEQADTQTQEPAPSAAELMKTLQAPLKEPEPAKPEQGKKAVVTQDRVEPETADKDTVEKAVDTVVKTTKKIAEASIKSVEKAVQSDSVKLEEAKTASEPAALKETERQAATLSKPAPATVTKKTVDTVSEPEPKADVSPVSQSGAKAFAVTPKQLPFTYDIWTIRKGNTPLTQGFVIVTPTWEMGKEGYMSQIWLTLMEDKIHVNSSSDIETASKGLGIRIDGGELIPFSSIAENNIGVIEGKWLDRLAGSERIEVYLGFFPGKKPTSDTFNSDLSLSNLDRIVATYRALNR